MVIRRHKIGKWSDIVSDAVIAYVYHDIDIIAADGFQDSTFGLSGTETCCLNREEIRISLITLESKGAQFIVGTFLTPLNQLVIDFFSQIFTADQWDQTQSAHRKCS